MTIQERNFRDAIVCSVIWFVCLLLPIVAMFAFAGWKTGLAALLPMIAFVDLVIWLGFSLVRLPCGFTEWVCYPFWPFKYHGFSMRTGVCVRIVEIITILISGHWLWSVVKALFQSQFVCI